MSDDTPAISRTDRLGRLVDAVTARTSGTAGDPLTRGEVEQVVRVTLEELRVEVPDPVTPSEKQQQQEAVDAADQQEADHDQQEEELPPDQRSPASSAFPVDADPPELEH